MTEEKKLTEKESLELITNMIGKAKSTYYDTGIGPILWGSVLTVASIVTYLELAYNFSIGFDIWLLVLAAIIPQVILSIKERRSSVVRKYEDDALNAVWLVFGISIFGLLAYRMIAPNASVSLIEADGWEVMKHYKYAAKPDEKIVPFVPSFYSLYILLYAFPTLVTGIVKKFRLMTAGAIITYGLFIVSCYTSTQYDMLLGAASTIICWLIPGIVIRRKYLAQRKANV